MLAKMISSAVTQSRQQSSGRAGAELPTSNGNISPSTASQEQCAPEHITLTGRRGTGPIPGSRRACLLAEDRPLQSRNRKVSFVVADELEAAGVAHALRVSQDRERGPGILAWWTPPGPKGPGRRRWRSASRWAAGRSTPLESRQRRRRRDRRLHLPEKGRGVIREQQALQGGRIRHGGATCGPGPGVR